jgi:hypothetical protein
LHEQGQTTGRFGLCRLFLNILSIFPAQPSMLSLSFRSASKPSACRYRAPLKAMRWIGFDQFSNPCHYGLSG